MRISKNAIRARTRDLPITFSDERISSHGGLEIVRHFFDLIDLRARVRDRLRGVVPDGDYGFTRILLALIGLLIVGGARVTHLAFLGSDPVFLRFCGLHRLPSDRTVVAWLKAFTPLALEALSEVIRDLVYEQIEWLGLRRVTLDLDGSVLRTGSHVEGAARGFNPHHPKDPSYYPLSVQVAQLGQILRIRNRPGNVHDSHNADGFLRVVVRELRERFGRRLKLELRMDGAFFHPDVFRFLDEKLGQGVEYAVKVPMWKWLGLLPRIASQKRWARVDAYVEGFETTLRIEQKRWDRTERVVVYRKRVSHESRKNFQLDLYSPDDGHYEYSAVATNKSLQIAPLWHFMAGRGAHEKTYAELKQHFGFAAIPSNDQAANSAWQLISVLTLNLMRYFQITVGARERGRTWKRTFDFVFQSMQTLRFELIQQPLRLVRPQGRPELRFAASPAARRRIQGIQRAVARAA
ncbi:MAG: IS1380 family transposase [Myxococcales bacterium]|nr:IS1380 family transposase [Myxococcales bacterium]